MGKGKGIVLYSGGLDSLLAAKILIEQGIEVIGFHCILPFVAPDFDPQELKSSIIAKQNGIELSFYRCDRDYLEMVKNPPHGYGKNLNPCIDCKIFFIKKAIELMKETGADFIATGEVVGQRPMSQMKDTLNHIVNETELKGRLLRPLSAKLLKPTVVEENGIVIREKLFDINGRSRKMQMELAEKYNIEEFSSPAGGCFFTDAFISKRVKDLLDNHEDYTPADLYFITIGRNFRISPRTKIIVSRNEEESNNLKKYMDMANYFFEPNFSGPNVFVKGELVENDKNLISSIISRYGKVKSDEGEIFLFKKGILLEEIKSTHPIDDEELKKMSI
ncbi:tRNA 4-thiouridine(8) synthase ThiI [Spirochaetota bacterium]